MKALTIMSVLALTISGIILLGDATATTGSAARIYAGGAVISDFVSQDPGASFVWKAN